MYLEIQQLYGRRWSCRSGWKRLHHHTEISQMVEETCYAHHNSIICTHIHFNFIRLWPGKCCPNGVPESWLSKWHFPLLIPSQEGAKSQRLCRKCVICKSISGKHNTAGVSRKRKETQYWCSNCDKAVC